MGYRGLYLLGIPVLVNIFLFYIHFAILTQSGPGNGFVSLPFQDTLLVMIFIVILVEPLSLAGTSH